MTDETQIEKVLSELINTYSTSGSENNIADFLFFLIKDFKVDTVYRQTLPTDRFNETDFTFTVEEPYYPAYEIDRNNPYIKKVSKIYHDVIGSSLMLEYSTGVSDSNCIVPLAGIPVLNVGPLGGGLHTANEWVSIESVMQMSEIYKRFLFDET